MITFKSSKAERKEIAKNSVNNHVRQVIVWADKLSDYYKGYVEANLAELCDKEIVEKLKNKALRQILFLECILGLTYYQKSMGYGKLSQQYAPLKRRMKIMAREKLGIK